VCRVIQPFGLVMSSRKDSAKRERLRHSLAWSNPFLRRGHRLRLGLSNPSYAGHIGEVTVSVETVCHKLLLIVK